MLMRCAAVGIGLPSVQPRARTSVTARKSASLQVEMVSTYSMWVEPTGKLAGQLQQQIDYLAEAYGGPTFPPHITLVGGVTGSEQQVLNTAKRLAGIIKPYRIRFDKPGYGSIYHQCIYMLCHQDDPTMKAGIQSKEAFSQDANSAYMPHLSLLYSDIDEHIRKQAVEVVKRRLHGEDKLLDGGFDVNSIHLYQTDPEDKLCETWKRVTELPLTT